MKHLPPHRTDGAPNLERMLSRQAVQSVLGISRSTIHRWMKHADAAVRLPRPVVIAGVHRWPESVIADYIERQKKEASL